MPTKVGTCQNGHPSALLQLLNTQDYSKLFASKHKNLFWMLGPYGKEVGVENFVSGHTIS